MDFEDYKIRQATITIDDKAAVSFGCVGTLDGTSETETVEKKCEGAVVKTKKKVKQVNVTMTGHATSIVQRDIMGMTNEGLKEGIYGYGDNIKPKKIVLTAIVEDMDGNIKYIAFPNMDDVKGFNIKINNDTTEIEMKDFEFAALKDENGFFYYDAFEKDIKDEDVKSKWLNAFTPELVKSVPGVGQEAA